MRHLVMLALLLLLATLRSALQTRADLSAPSEGTFPSNFFPAIAENPFAQALAAARSMIESLTERTSSKTSNSATLATCMP
jgi:hypothetical protein